LNGYNTDVKELKPCSGNRLDAIKPGRFMNVEKYDISFKEVGVLTSTDLKFASLKKLDASNNKLTSISGSIFFHATRLEEIDFNNNKIGSLNRNDFSGASKLSTIKLVNNKISNIDKGTFSDLSQLAFLDLSDNSIEKIDENMFKNNKNLQTLYLNGNPIQRIDNNIFIPLSNSASVIVSCDHVKEFDSSHFTSSITFNYDHIKVSIGDCRIDYKNLKYLNISGNQLQNTLEVIKHFGSSMETLDASSNFIGKLTAETFKDLVNLNYLNLQNTNTTTIDADTFNPLLFPESDRKLQVLLLSDNPIKRLDSNVFLPMMNSVKVEVKVSCEYVEEIDTSYIKNLLNIDVNAADKIVFTIKNAAFELICTAERFKQLTHFNISGNQLENGQKIIEWIENSTEVGTETSNCRLSIIDFSNNNIADLNEGIFNRTPDLIEINFSRNLINELPQNIFEGASKLSTINFSKNNITILQEDLFFHTPDLIEIDFSYNKFTALRQNDFDGAANLTKINLSHNNISIIETGIFTN
ncbi:relaxin receptor 1-like, partial [Sitodiplosis mosellana]|uniref:relaxin receptor 1-like n=1 Tax=Sitodiplosis mosellana TaxID=263140 RepID=UPI0024450CBA